MVKDEVMWGKVIDYILKCKIRYLRVNIDGWNNWINKWERISRFFESSESFNNLRDYFIF